MHPQLIAGMRRQPAFTQLERTLPQPGTTRIVSGLSGSATTLLAAALADANPNRLWVVIAPTPPEAESIEADLHAYLEESVTALYPQRETLPYEASEHHLEVSGLRVEALEALLAGRARILVTTARALQERAEMPSALADLRLTVRVGENVRPADLVEKLEAMGFEKTPLVEGVGEFAVRGGILDVFGFGSPDPLRIEFWGDEIVSIRHFDILDQRSTDEVRSIDVLPVDVMPATGESGASVRRSLLDVIPRDAILIHLGAITPVEEFMRTWTQVLHLHEAERKRGGSPEAPETLFLPPDDAAQRMRDFGNIAVQQSTTPDVAFQCQPSETIERDMSRLSAVLRAGAARHEETYILCDNSGQMERLEELLRWGEGLPPHTHLAIGTVAEGYILEGASPIVRVLTDHEIFRRARRIRRQRRFRGAVALESVSQLREGDFVVHLDHGIGRFLGMERVRVGDEEIESLAIEYAGGEKLRVPVYRIDLIERWVSDRDDAPPPKMHKIGGKTWKQLRAKTEKAIEETARELLQIYARRQMAERPPYSADSRWQKEMESSFLYEDTPDQRQATIDLKRDLESRHPMDRLVCGDVGYGKTEVAIRAAFKAVQDGRQVAVLAPTTILVEQHLHTFSQRLAGYPVRIEAISRFRTASEQRAILNAVAQGEVDILIGTHAILEPDIAFKNLGMLIVDEEQRFGVKQKERYKELKANLDVLSLTATPIPRTLHLSLTGLRDMSLLQTPPRDRMPIITHVLPWVDEVLEDAIRRELDRGGQVFFVHNRIQTIDGAAIRVQRLVPDAKIVIAHGQMPAPQLDDVMRQFLEGDAQILVTTAIIENGLDVPTANTLIVDRADYFGLAQLYQLRGRVGRSHHRAYCYLVVPEGINEDAEKRLRILEHFTELGSGYAIALKDLEMRGAGNILGGEQSGFVHQVGLDTYTRLMEQTIRRLKEEPGIERFGPTEVTIQGAALLPDEYVTDASQKLTLYRRIAKIERIAEVQAIADELRDRFGPPPPEAERLLAAVAMRLIGTELGVERITLQDDSARISFREGVTPRLAALQATMREHQVEIDVRRAMPLSFIMRRRGARPIVESVTAALAGLRAA